MVAREQSGFASRNNKLYIIGGHANCSPKDFTEYDPITGIMTKLKNLGGGCGNPVYARCTFIVQNKLYIAQDTRLIVYDFATNTWANAILLPVPTNFDAASGFVINNVIYVSSGAGNFLCSYDTTTGQAVMRANYPGSSIRRGSIGFAINNMGYLGAGTASSTNSCNNNQVGCFLNEFYQYNPSTDSWTVKASLPTAFNFGVGISVNGKGYAGTGESANGLNLRFASASWYEYDPVTNIWTSKQNFANNPTTSGISFSSVTAIGNDIYMFGGQIIAGGRNFDDLLKYNTVNNTWSIVDAELGRNRERASGFFLNGKVYIGGGEDSEGLNDFWEYDGATDNWLQKANMPTIHCDRAVAEVGSKGYFVGGFSDNILNTTANPEANKSDALEEYNPATNTWTAKAPYPAGKRHGMIAMSYNGKLYAGQGRDVAGSQTNGFFEYNPTTNTWISKISVPFVGAYCSSFVVGNIGYVISFTPQKLVGKYNFDTNTWTTEPHTLNTDILQNGNPSQNAFAYNGFGYLVHDGGILSKYNPTNSTWTQVTNLSSKNQSQNLIPANNGIYFGFGKPEGISHPLGLPTVNDWRFLKFDTAVSNKFGVYISGINPNIDVAVQNCGTGNLTSTMNSTIYDENGDLHAAISTTGNLPSFCFEISATNLTIPFKTATSNFGNGFQESAMFLNKSAFFVSSPNSNSLGNFRFYFTTAELNKLVTDFNLLHNTTKTINDIRIVRHINPFAYNNSDNNPLNNTVGTYNIFATQITSYGIDKYFDIPTGGNWSGEIYAVLLTGENLSNDAFSNKKISIYPNPATNILNISLEENATIERVTITDISGKKVMEQDGNVSTVNIERLANGMYVLEVISGGNKMVEKFIKE